MIKTEIKNIYKIAQKEIISDSFNSTGGKIYAYCKNEKCGKELDISGGNNTEYYIKFDTSGKVVKYYATNGVYQYGYSGFELKVTDIKEVEYIPELESSDIISIAEIFGNTKSYKVSYIVYNVIKNSEKGNYEFYSWNNESPYVELNSTYSQCSIVIKNEYYSCNDRVDVLDNYKYTLLDSSDNYHEYDVKTDATRYRIWYTNTYTNNIITYKEYKAHFFWRYPKELENTEQILIAPQGEYSNNWNIEDGPDLEFSTPIYFSMPEQDVVLFQFMRLDNI